jgi:hypothetical protein
MLPPEQFLSLVREAVPSASDDEIRAAIQEVAEESRAGGERHLQSAEVMDKMEAYAQKMGWSEDTKVLPALLQAAADGCPEAKEIVTEFEALASDSSSFR